MGRFNHHLDAVLTSFLVDSYVVDVMVRCELLMLCVFCGKEVVYFLGEDWEANFQGVLHSR